LDQGILARGSIPTRVAAKRATILSTAEFSASLASTTRGTTLTLTSTAS
jgi:hypothetical protein